MPTAIDPVTRRPAAPANWDPVAPFINDNPQKTLPETLREMAQAAAGRVQQAKARGDKDAEAKARKTYMTAMVNLTRLSKGEDPASIANELRLEGFQNVTSGTKITAEGSNAELAPITGDSFRGYKETYKKDEKGNFQKTYVREPKSLPQSVADIHSLSGGAGSRVAESRGVGRLANLAVGAADIGAGVVVHGLEGYQRLLNAGPQTAMAVVAPETFKYPNLGAPVGTDNSAGLVNYQNPEEIPAPIRAVTDALDLTMAFSGVRAGVQAAKNILPASRASQRAAAAKEILSAKDIPAGGLTPAQALALQDKGVINTLGTRVKSATLMGEGAEYTAPIARPAQKLETAAQENSKIVATDTEHGVISKLPKNSWEAIWSQVRGNPKLRKEALAGALDPTNPDFQNFAYELVTDTQNAAKTAVSEGKIKSATRASHSPIVRWVSDGLQGIKSKTFPSRTSRVYGKIRQQVTGGVLSDEGSVNMDEFARAVSEVAGEPSAPTLIKNAASQQVRSASTEAGRMESARIAGEVRQGARNDEIMDAVERIDTRMADKNADIASKKDLLAEKAGLDAVRTAESVEMGSSQELSSAYNASRNMMLKDPRIKEQISTLFKGGVNRGYLSEENAARLRSNIDISETPKDFQSVIQSFEESARADLNAHLRSIPADQVKKASAAGERWITNAKNRLSRELESVSGMINADMAHGRMQRRGAARAAQQDVAALNREMGARAAEDRVTRMEREFDRLGSKKDQKLAQLQDPAFVGGQKATDAQEMNVKSVAQNLSEAIASGVKSTDQATWISPERAARMQAVVKAISGKTKKMSVNQLEELISNVSGALSTPSGVRTYGNSPAEELLQRMLKSLRSLRDDMVKAAILRNNTKQTPAGYIRDVEKAEADWKAYQQAKQAKDDAMDTRFHLSAFYFDTPYGMTTRSAAEADLLQKINTDVGLNLLENGTGTAGARHRMELVNSVFNDQMPVGATGGGVKNFLNNTLNAAARRVASTKSGTSQNLVNPDVQGSGTPHYVGNELPENIQPGNRLWHQGSGGFEDNKMAVTLRRSIPVAKSFVYSLFGLDPLTAGALSARDVMINPTGRSFLPMKGDMTAPGATRSQRVFDTDELNTASRKILNRIVYGGTVKGDLSTVKERGMRNALALGGNQIQQDRNDDSGYLFNEAEKAMGLDPNADRATDDELVTFMESAPEEEISGLISRILFAAGTTGIGSAVKEAYNAAVTAMGRSDLKTQVGKGYPAEMRLDKNGQPLWERGGPSRAFSEAKGAVTGVVDKAVEAISGAETPSFSTFTPKNDLTPQGSDLAKRVLTATEGRTKTASGQIAGILPTTWDLLKKKYPENPIFQIPYAQLETELKDPAKADRIYYEVADYHLREPAYFGISMQDVENSPWPGYVKAAVVRMSLRTNPPEGRKLWTDALLRGSLGTSILPKLEGTKLGEILRPGMSPEEFFKKDSTTGKAPITMYFDLLSKLQGATSESAKTKFIDDLIASFKAWADTSTAKNGILQETEGSLRKFDTILTESR